MQSCGIHPRRHRISDHFSPHLQAPPWSRLPSSRSWSMATASSLGSLPPVLPPSSHPPVTEVKLLEFWSDQAAPCSRPSGQFPVTKTKTQSSVAFKGLCRPAPAMSPSPSPVTLPLAHCTPAAPASFLFPEHDKHIPTSGPLPQSAQQASCRSFHLGSGYMSPQESYS